VRIGPIGCPSARRRPPSRQAQPETVLSTHDPQRTESARSPSHAVRNSRLSQAAIALFPLGPPPRPGHGRPPSRIASGRTLPGAGAPSRSPVGWTAPSAPPCCPPHGARPPWGSAGRRCGRPIPRVPFRPTPPAQRSRIGSAGSVPDPAGCARLMGDTMGLSAGGHAAHTGPGMGSAGDPPALGLRPPSGGSPAVALQTGSGGRKFDGGLGDSTSSDRMNTSYVSVDLCIQAPFINAGCIPLHQSTAAPSPRRDHRPVPEMSGVTCQRMPGCGAFFIQR